MIKWTLIALFQVTFHANMAMPDSQRNLIKNVEDNVVFLSRISVYYCKFLRRFSLSRIAQISFEEKLLIHHLNKQKHGYLINTWSDKLFKGTFVKQALPSLYGGSRKITCTVPLSYFFIVTQKLYQNVKYKDDI